MPAGKVDNVCTPCFSSLFKLCELFIPRGWGGAHSPSTRRVFGAAENLHGAGGCEHRAAGEGGRSLQPPEGMRRRRSSPGLPRSAFGMQRARAPGVLVPGCSRWQTKLTGSFTCSLPPDYSGFTSVWSGLSFRGSQFHEDGALRIPTRHPKGRTVTEGRGVTPPRAATVSHLAPQATKHHHHHDRWPGGCGRSGAGEMSLSFKTEVPFTNTPARPCCSVRGVQRRRGHISPGSGPHDTFMDRWLTCCGNRDEGQGQSGKVAGGSERWN